MANNSERFISIAKDILSIAIIVLLGAVGVIFSVLFLNAFSYPLVADHKTLFIILAVSIVSILTVITIILYKVNQGLIYKLCYLAVILIAAAVLILFSMQKSGFLDKIDNIEDFRDYIESFGGGAVFLFILIQFLQVAILPIPGGVTIAAGVLLFGPFLGAVYSLIGILIGSIAGFAIGKIFGYKVASWLVGKEELDKGLESVKGKDRVVLTFMFLLPFFPDDLLCFVAGLSSMSWPFFIVMITITRVISVFLTSYSLNNSFIPYNTWWGILIWALIIVGIAVLTVIIYKNGEKIESFFKKRFTKKKDKTDN